MKKTKDYTILTLLICLLLAIAGRFVSCSNDMKNKKVVNVEYFKNGQILYPDYACVDTLIVRDAAGLNKGMALIEQGIIDATDYEIDSVLHSHCDYYIGSFEDQFSKLKALQPTWDSLQIVAAINED